MNNAAMPRQSNWRTNLIVLWFGQFMVTAGMTMVIPFLPYYIQEMGVTDPDHVNLWAGIIFAANFITSFAFQPFWGSLADRYGRKIMLLRSGFGMSIVMVLMGFSQSPWHLLLLRMLNGTVSGFLPAAVSLQSATTPREHAGFAMGVLQSGQVAGTILGPLIGGSLAFYFGYRPIFYITGTLLLLATLLAWRLVHEQFDRAKAAAKPKRSVWEGWGDLKKVPQLPALFAVTFMIQFGMLSSMPLIPMYVQEMHGLTPHIALYSGLVGAVTGISNMIASPLLGRVSDRIGAQKVLVVSLIGAGIMFIPQAFVANIWQLLACRFVLGVFVGGLAPSVNSLVQKHTPEGMEGRAFSFNSSSLALGNMVGPTLGGFLAAWLQIEGIFLMAAVMFFVNLWWVRHSLLRPKSQGGIA